MSGIKQWSKNVEVQANPGKRLRFIDASITTPLAAGAAIIVNLYAPPGYITRVKIARIRYDVIGGAASGTTTVQVYINSSALLTTSDVPYNFVNEYGYGRWTMPAGSAVSPADLTAQFMSQHSMVFDQFNPIQVAFSNKTPVADGGTNKFIFLWVEDEKITS